MRRVFATVALLGCTGAREPQPIAREKPLATLVNETGEAIEIPTVRSGAIVKCDAVLANEEAVVLAAILAHPETGDRANTLKIAPAATAELALGKTCAAFRIGEWHALVHAGERLSLRRREGVVELLGSHVHRPVAPPERCAIEPLFFTPHMADLMDREWRIEDISPGSCLAIDVRQGERRDRWKFCAPEGSWPFEKGATVKPYSHGTGLSFLGKGLNLVLEQPKLPLTDLVDVEIHVAAERAGSPCIVPPSFDIAVPEGAVVVPANLAITLGNKPKRVLQPNTSIELQGTKQKHHFAFQSAQHVLAVPSYFAQEGTYDRGAWVYWTSP